MGRNELKFRTFTYFSCCLFDLVGFFDKITEMQELLIILFCIGFFGFGPGWWWGVFSFLFFFLEGGTLVCFI